MAETTSRERLQPSLLDRLTDQRANTRAKASTSRRSAWPQLRQAVLRDLAWLLNTTNLAATEDLAGLPLLTKSTVNYGVPGLAGMVSSSNRLSAMEAGIAEAIRAFEPRIRPDTLRVRLRETDADKPTPSIVFEIQGELWAQPVPEQLFLESSIELETRLAVVTEAKMRG